MFMLQRRLESVDRVMKIILKKKNQSDEQQMGEVIHH